MPKQIVQSPDAPAAIGPYSQAVLAGNTLYMSGQIPLDPRTGQLVEGIEAQAHQVFRNLRAVQINFERVVGRQFLADLQVISQPVDRKRGFLGRQPVVAVTPVLDQPARGFRKQK